MAHGGRQVVAARRRWRGGGRSDLLGVTRRQSALCHLKSGDFHTEGETNDREMSEIDGTGDKGGGREEP